MTKARATTPPTLERVTDLFSLESGDLRWRVHKASNARAGQLAGTRRKDGYVKISIDGVQCLAHHIVWLLEHGSWPAGELDHADRVPGHDAVSNLRPASRSQQMANAKMRSDNTSGVKGVSWSKEMRRWQARIYHNGRGINLGYFDDLGEAAEAYAVAARRLFGDFANPERRA